MRIQELAKKYNVTADELIALLKKAGHSVSSATSEIDYDMLTALDRHFSWSNTATKKPAKKASSAAKKSKTSAAEASEPAAIKAKVKLRKAHAPVPEPEPAPVPEKPKVKLAKAVKAVAVATEP